ncbi:MAG: hypothetical protein IT479_07620 [Xanthomonadales bacterium]|nr:hypothetical protein [Xanthomonadales bacterium]MCC6593128.1 hypothetical protein [Xanthomonadales bacterium]MCE7930264.1 hypothetical protein [Xanthomonadales bacterium PRO6]
MSLRRRLAAHGFESNDDYEFALRLLFEAQPAGVRCLNIAGESGRRKTALAHALAAALDYPHVLYHDFSQPEPPAPTLVDAETGETRSAEAPASGFDRVLTEACAYSEGARVVLILDQIQASEFADQIRLYQFVQSREWQGVAGTVLANAATLLLVLISEDALYHSLQKASFRVWADVAGGTLDFDPKDFGLGPEARGLFTTLGELFRQLGQSPTASEFARILADLLARVRSIEQLRTSLFGWMENLERERLHAAAVRPLLDATIVELERLLGVEEISLTVPGS